MDSPNNVETDDKKESSFIKFLLSNSDLSCQFIISGIGFDSDRFRSLTNKEMNFIVLENDKYHLLQEEDYHIYSSLMTELCDAE